MAAKQLDEEAIFNAARRIESAEERGVFIRHACSGDDAFAERVRALLEMHERDPDFLAGFGQNHNGTIDYAPITEKPGTMIGPYKLKEQIGEGGFGLVFVAEQQEPVKRKVALKVIKPGMDTREVMARFTAERQALALMDHPNIARVLDAGATDSGRPYFVMELVRGIPITDYCDQNQLSPRDRLGLFITVCQAVQHAHQKGIIHRDIKPSNVLVTSHDGKPVAKVIDFGVAKAISHQLTDRSIYTNFAQMIGTPLYMSPEQAEMSGLDIDTRSDIYSLGVLLYELLTGTTPLDKKRFAKAAYDEIRRMIREDEPQKPSTRLSTSDSIASIAAQRHIEPAKLSKLMRGDLDWITMKALEKDRTRRYETANGLARDIQRYLNDEAVEACPPSASYRLKKFVRRNKGQVIAASLILFALLAGIAGTAFGLIRAEEQRRVAELASKAETKRAESEAKERQRAEAGEKLAGERLSQVEAEKKKAEEEKKIAVAVKDFLENKLLGQADMTEQANALLKAGGMLQAVKTNPTIRELLDRAADELSEQKIEASFPNQPLLQAEILLTVGSTYIGIGEAERAIGLLQRSVALRKRHSGADSPITIVSMTALAHAYGRVGKLDLALPLYKESLRVMKSKLGHNHPLTLQSMNNLAIGYQAMGKLDLALPLFKEAVKLTDTELGHDHFLTLRVMNNLGMAYVDAARLDLALPLLEETFNVQKTILGAEHPETLGTMNNLAATYQAAGKRDLALPLFQEVLNFMKVRVGPEHPETLQCMNNLAVVYWSAGQLDKSIPLFEEVLKLKEKKLGRGHPDSLMTVANLGVNYKDAGRLAEALPLLEEGYQAVNKYPQQRIVGPSLLEAYVRVGKTAQAARLLDELLADARKQLPKDSPQLVQQLYLIGMALLQAKDFPEAEPVLRECLAIREKTQPDAWNAFSTQSMLGGALLGQKKYAEAEPLLLKGYEGMKQREDKIPLQGKIRLQEAVERLAQLYEALDKPDEAAKWKAELAAMKPAP